MTSTRQIAEKLLREFKVERPDQIDVQEIAQSLKAKVVYRSLRGAAAMLVGYGDSARITVDADASVERQRFSIAHELGHWIFDHGQQVLTTTMSQRQVQAAEKRANQFAGDLLLPDFLVRPRVEELEVEFNTIDWLRRKFRTSQTATGIKLMQCTSLPCLLCCYTGQGQLKWQVPSPSFPLRVPPHTWLDAGTAAARSSERRVSPQAVPLSAWFTNAGDEHLIIEESMFSSRFDMVLSLLRWPQDQPLSTPAA